MFKWFADYVTYDFLHLNRGSHFAESLNFFIYDVPKIYFLLIVIVFFVAFIRTFLPPERIRKILSHKNEFIGNILAAILGIFTPFCTCSAIPLFIGMLESGVPLGVTMSFLVASPTINEVALIMLWGLFGWQVAVIMAVIIGVPLYSNAAGTIPIVQALFNKGLALGTTLAFMMAVTSLSLPEFIILRKVLKLRLLLTYFGTVAGGIIVIGYFFNLIF